MSIFSIPQGGRMDESIEPKKTISLQWDDPWLEVRATLEEET